jgi:hypothetical protein
MGQAGKGQGTPGAGQAGPGRQGCWEDIKAAHPRFPPVISPGSDDENLTWFKMDARITVSKRSILGK